MNLPCHRSTNRFNLPLERTAYGVRSLSRYASQMQTPRPVLASLVAPLAALLPILAIATYEMTQPVAIVNGEADDAPQRALGVLLIALPIIYVVLAVAAYGAGALFLRLGFRTMGKFILASVLLAVLLSVPFSIRTAGFGTQDQIISTLVFGALFAVSVIPGAACWLLLARRHSDA